MTLIRHRDHAIANGILAVIFHKVKYVTRCARAAGKCGQDERIRSQRGYSTERLGRTAEAGVKRLGNEKLIASRVTVAAGRANAISGRPDRSVQAVWIMPSFHRLHEHLFLGIHGIVRIVDAIHMKLVGFKAGVVARERIDIVITAIGRPAAAWI